MTDKKSFLFYSPENLILSSKNNFLKEQFKSKLSKDENKQMQSLFREKVGEEHPFDYELVEGIAKKFGLVGAIIDKVLDFTIGPQLFIQSEDDKVVEILEDWMKKTHLKKFLRPWFKESLMKGSGYLEIAGLSDFNVDDTIKVVNSNTIYVKRDEFGNITNYNQFLGKNINRIEDEDIIKLNKDEIIQLDINKLGNSAYGMGIIYSGIPIIEDFLSAQKAMHKIMKRKANNPVHVKMGNADKDIFPEQADIDAFGDKLQYMNECTEWVTDDTVDMNVLDFGDVGEKFAIILENDLKLLSYSFQVPESLLGAQAGGLAASGHANMQMDAFERNIKSYQDQIELVLMTKVFDKVLINSGKINADYAVVWGQQNEEDKNAKLTTYKELLGVMNLSPGLRMELEKKIADLEEIDYIEIEKNNARELRRENREKKKSFDQQLQLQAQRQQPNPQRQQEKIDIHDLIFERVLQGMAPQEIEAEFLEKNIKTNIDVFEASKDEIDNLYEDVELEEWIGEYYQIKSNIIDVIKKDGFENLKAKTRTDLALGKLNKKQVEGLRTIMEDAFKNREGLHKIAKKIDKLKLKDRYKIDKDGKRVLSVTAKNRSFMIARSETVRLRAEGSLDRFKEKNVNKVVFTLVSSKPCPQCEALDGKEYNINESSGVIPVHSMCRCRWETA